MASMPRCMWRNDGHCGGGSVCDDMQGRTQGTALVRTAGSKDEVVWILN